MSQPHPSPQYPGPQQPANGPLWPAHPQDPAQYPYGGSAYTGQYPQFGGYPPNGYPPNGYPPNGYPPNGYPPNGVPPRRPAKRGGGTTVAVVAISVVVVVLLLIGLIFAGVVWKASSLAADVNDSYSRSNGDDGDGTGDGSGGFGITGDDDGTTGTSSDIVPCSDSTQYTAYSQLVNDTYDKYMSKLEAGTIFDDLNLPANQDSADYVHDFMLIITDRKSALRFGCEITTDVDELDDIYETKSNEVKELERKLNAHEDFGITIRITRSDGSVYESDGGAPPEQTIDDVEAAIRAVPVTPGADGTYLAAGESVAKAAGLSTNYDFQQIYQYCMRTGSDEYTMAAFCSASPRVVYVNKAHAAYSTNITDPYYVDVMKHEMGHALVFQQCGTTRPPVGVSGEALANSYALKYLGGNRDNLQANIDDYPEYTMSDASDRAAERVHNGTCVAG